MGDMERGELKAWLEQGLSLEQIAALVDRHPSTVGYWCIKFGLTPNGRAKHAARGGLTLAQLEPLVEAGLSTREIASEVGRSPATVRHWLRRYALRTVRAYRRDVPKRPEIFSVCRKHGAGRFVLDGEGSYRCTSCRVEAVTMARRRTKQRLVAKRGGRCERCGYDKHLSALQFHHRERSEKAFMISRNGAAMSFAELEREVAKCVLLCANCHAEVEWGGASLPDLT